MKKVYSSFEQDRTKPAELAKQIKFLLKELPEIRADAARLDELRRVFARLETAGELEFTTPARSDTASVRNPVAAKWSAFLHKSHEAMVTQLCERVRLGRHASIRCLVGVIAGSPRSIPMTKMNRLKDGGKSPSELPCKIVNIDLLQKWIWAMTLQNCSEMDKGMRHMVQAEVFAPYRDVQYFSLSAITKLATSVYEGDYEYANAELENAVDDDEATINENKIKVAEKLFELLIMIPVPHSDKDLEIGKQYLFPPPLDVIPGDIVAEESEESDMESEDSSSDSDSSDDSNDEENSKEEKKIVRPTKRQKKDIPRKFPFQQMRMFRREFTKAWLAVLRLPLPSTSLKKALNILPQTVLNYVAQPLRFADFFMQAYSDHSSGIIGVLALEGLFVLITKCKDL